MTRKGGRQGSAPLRNPTPRASQGRHEWWGSARSVGAARYRQCQEGPLTLNRKEAPRPVLADTILYVQAATGSSGGLLLPTDEKDYLWRAPWAQVRADTGTA